MSTDNETKAPAAGTDTGGQEPDDKSPEQIQKEIETTREELGETVEAVAAKTDVKAQAKRKAASVKDQVASKAADTKEKVSATADDVKAKTQAAAPESATAGAQQAQQIARENPMPAAIAGAFAAGVIVGWLISR